MKGLCVSVCVLATAGAAQAASPTLSISQVSPASLQFSWPSNFSDWQLKFTTNLSLTNWQAVIQTPVFSGTSLVVSFPFSNASGYFRLQQANSGGSGGCLFQATPPQINAGASSLLTWCPQAGTTYRISPGPGIVSGSSLSVSPASTTVYSLIASNAQGVLTNNAAVIVGPCGWLQVAIGM